VSKGRERRASLNIFEEGDHPTAGETNSRRKNQKTSVLEREDDNWAYIGLGGRSLPEIPGRSLGMKWGIAFSIGS